ncbi:Cytoplasmic dynein 2 light intermediate chain 1 [Trichinella pseudospiralis]|uniref:Cytoplasmic dynein 2 light intermediate chain 1 n=2 Tax=Trichinella pseudospiralis TaxID=6337 RepID=A0A0V0XQK3_TRIPS|nr:Cytoplasmic dynein 2 light intermediate chain 1 [Trichinella pseudospiralis]KRY72362.1 Cytoplasmic dynein 2 light intermediate chain 1 [Trichinella pseudospiralis]KRY82414.1 Cytoplasmic dynein 2 light intermediate chain 1 [Trichinella pseudospiralis]KRZ19599.1 Cytoplasmic dynein 2 light intermediate chain 1 [Trichinella pseudospiralis]KRZ36629.1 Cytoplasmic dynein 2 light intermediate chain 1 [Trichinella pseudospiralis]
MLMDIFQLVEENGSKENKASSPIKASVRSDDENESILILCGSKNSDKSTLVSKFMEREEQQYKICAMEYTFARWNAGNVRTVLCEEKKIGHIYQIEDGLDFINLFKSIRLDNMMNNAAVIVMVNLAEPAEIWTTLEQFLSMTRDHLLKLLMKQNDNVQEMLVRKAAKPYESHPDKRIVKPYPIPLCIIGGNYSDFQNIEPEKKKIICRSLRLIAHLNGATLQFLSFKMDNLIVRGRALFSHFLFKTFLSKSICTDFNKPVYVNPGADSISVIDSNIVRSESATYEAVMKTYGAEFTSIFNKKETTNKIDEQLLASKEQFKEEAIDSLKFERDQELERYVKRLEKSKL